MGGLGRPGRRGAGRERQQRGAMRAACGAEVPIRVVRVRHRPVKQPQRSLWGLCVCVCVFPVVGCARVLLHRAMNHGITGSVRLGRGVVQCSP